MGVREHTAVCPGRTLCECSTQAIESLLVNVHGDDLGAAVGAEHREIAIVAPDIHQGIGSKHRKSGDQFTVFLIEPAVEMCLTSVNTVGETIQTLCVGRCRINLYHRLHHSALGG